MGPPLFAADRVIKKHVVLPRRAPPAAPNGLPPGWEALTGYDGRGWPTGESGWAALIKMTASGGAKGLRMPQPATLATSAALVSTGAVFVRSKMTQTAVTAVANPKMAEGLAYSFAALCGNTAASLLRKQVSRSSKVKPAEQVGLATALQGVVACAYCAQQGLFSTAVTSAFLIPAVGSAVLNALTKTLETKAYAITDVSLCAPFLAFDPVMQFLLPVLTRRLILNCEVTSSPRRRRATRPA